MQYFHKDTLELSELKSVTALMFVNVNEVMCRPESFSSNVIRVVGLQISQTGNLSSEIKSFIESGEKYSISFSMGFIFAEIMWRVKKRKNFTGAPGAWRI